jgi:hypothetical protein
MKTFKNLKFATIMVALALFLVSGSFADEVKYTDSWGKAGYTVTTQKSSDVEINYSINSFQFLKENVNGEMLDIINLPGNFLQNDEGAPNLPGMGRYIAIPQGANAKLHIMASRTEVFENVDMAPAPRIPWDTEDGPLDFAKDQKIFMENALYPDAPVKLSTVTQIRGVDVVMLGITPFQYNPITKQLIVYRDIQVKVTFEGGNGQFGDERLRSRWWDPLFSDMLLNYESLPKMNYNKSYQGPTDDLGCEYLIVTPTGPEFIQWADSIKKFRTQQGILTDIKTLEDIGGNNVNTLENYFNNAYNTWDIVPSAVLLLADYGTSQTNSITSPIWDNYCVSDNIFADVNNNDMPDIIFARMTANNAAQLEVMITKFLDYERTPPTSPDFYDHPITALGFQTERWFQICSEAVAGFWENELGKNTVRVNKTYIGSPNTDPWSTATNTSTVVNYFGPSGLGYIPATPGQVNCTWNGSGNDVVNAINSGAFILQHRDHGYEGGWGEPDFGNSNINSLTNTDLTFIWSINCLTGKYNYGSECFAEKFHRYTYGGQNAGALGLIAASEVSYSFVNDTYVWGAYDNQWPEFMPDYGTTPESRDVMPAFGNAAGKYFLQQSSWPYNTNNKEVTYNLFHHHGDAFLRLYSEIPQDLTVSHNPILYAGVTFFDVTADADALIALTVNDEIIGTAFGTGAPVSIEIPGQVPPDQVLVVITKQNYYRYSALVDVIPPSGPYVVHIANAINDENGNNNGMMDTDESILSTVTVENVGVEVASDVEVTISTDDEYITITDATENYGDIAAGGQASVNDAFAWDVHDNIPDMHMVSFEVNATDGTDTWTTSFAVQGHAPALEAGSMTVNDAAGNGNGQLDPGETADITIQATNAGSAHAYDAMGYLTSSSGYITIVDGEHDFSTIGSGLTEDATFTIEVAGNAPIGTTADFMFEATSGSYNVVKNYTASIGLIVEDWETGTMTQYDWQTGGNVGWDISTESPYEGAYCVKSGDINDNQTSTMELDYDVMGDDEISFFYKVSSESNYDYLRFYIDGAQVGEWAGEEGWAEAVYPVAAGSHTFKWEYYKDYSVSSGGDCAWVDFILLPSPPVTTAYAGSDDLICESVPFYQLEGAATLYDMIHWETSGTGSFDFDDELDPKYTPSTDDIANGGVTLSITAYGPSSNVTDEMELSISQIATAFAGEDAEVCATGGYELADATAENYASIAWLTEGDGTFDAPGTVNPTYTPGAMDLTNGTVTLTMVSISNDPCSDADDEIVLTFTPAATAFAGDDDEICAYDPYTLAGATAENYSALMWTTSGDGTFDDATMLNPTYTAGSGDVAEAEVTLTLTVTGNGPCGEVADDIFMEIGCQGIGDNNANNGVAVFPNPNSGSFNLEINAAGQSKVDITIYNALSKVVYEAKNVSINGSLTEAIELDVEQGVYYVRIEGDDLLLNKKVIIQK